MALFNFKCNGPCQSEVRKILNLEQVASVIGTICGKPDCGGTWQRNQSAPTTQVYETLPDNGLQIRRIERLAEVERLFKERADKHRGKDSS